MVDQIRLAELLGALSLTTDLGSGVAFEKGLRTCLVAVALADALEADLPEQRAAYQVGLLRALGCTAYAPENAARFGDDMAFQAAIKQLDPGDPAAFGAQFGSWAGTAEQPKLAQKFVAVAPTYGPEAVGANCEVSIMLGARLRLSDAALRALDDVYERWDGHGFPRGRGGQDLALAARVMHVAEQVVFAEFESGRAGAVTNVEQRSGGQLDPDICACFLAHSDEVFDRLDAADVLAAVIEAEPPPAVRVPVSELQDVCVVFATFADLKGRHLLGHSLRVAELAVEAARSLGVDNAGVGMLRLAALMHDIGRVAVSSSVWNRPGPLGAGDLERVRLHPYWTARILARCPALAPLAPIAAADHERLDGSGYHRGVRGADLPLAARVLATADAFAAMSAERAYRPALAPEEAAKALLDEAAAGRLDPQAVGAIVEAARLPKPRSVWPCDLTDREVEVLRLAARGLSNREIAERLVVSDRTVQHHLASVYDKTGRRTRAGAAVFAMEHHLVPAGAAE
ncbi:MAG TPA: HD domain-containing phosphohydrolase [Solirubrobacteraceae bacterium]|nr:HD domain-containing phosphohydrolase [Solirubrobacteraceae bacterium]